MSYLSPDVPRWVPNDEAAIEAAAQGGLLEESHYLDLKASVPPGPGKNRELARDLASFAVDGGTLVIGVAEQDSDALELAPIELAGLAERVEQVARSSRILPFRSLAGPCRRRRIRATDTSSSQCRPPARLRTWSTAPTWGAATRRRPS